VGSVVGSFEASTSGNPAKSINILPTTKSIHNAEHDLRAFIPNLFKPGMAKSVD
jgi:hypothetical protein